MEIIEKAPLIRANDITFKIESRVKSAQVAGTNGKGSTCAFLHRILISHGKRVGLYTSPHVLDYVERIAINGEYISKKDFALNVEYFHGLENDLCKSDLMFFSAVKYFNEQKVDFAIYETGLGGTLDSATLMDHDYGALTAISLDHTDLLGDTIELITKEKCGIIKDGMTVVTYPNECMDIIYNSSKKAKLIDSSFACIYPQGEGFDLVFEEFTLKDVKLGLKGEFQRKNAIVALLLAREILGNEFNKDKAKSALENTRLLGRMTPLPGKNNVYVDVAHNEESIKGLCDFVDSKSGSKLAVIAIKNTKDYSAMINRLKKSFDVIIGTKSDDVSFDPRIFNVDDVIENWREAYCKGVESKHDLVVFCGSFSLAKKILSNN